MKESVSVYLRALQRKARLGLLGESLLLGSAAFLVTAAAARMDRLSVFQPASLFAEFFAALVLALTWVRASKLSAQRVLRKVDRQLEFEDRLVSAGEILRKNGEFSQLEWLCLHQAQALSEATTQRQAQFFRPTLFLLPLSAAFIFVLAENHGETRSVFSFADTAVVSHLENTSEDLKQSLSRESANALVQFEKTVREFEAGSLSRGKLREELEEIHQQLVQLEKNWIEQEKEKTAEGSTSSGQNSSGEKLAQAISSLEKAMERLPVSNSEGVASAASKEISTEILNNPEADRTRILSNYRWPARFDSVVENYFRGKNDGQGQK